MGVSFPSLRVSKPLEILKREFDNERDKQYYVGNLLIEFFDYVGTNPSEHRIEGLLLKMDSLFLYADERRVDLTNQRRVYRGLLEEYKLRESVVNSTSTVGGNC